MQNISMDYWICVFILMFLTISKLHYKSCPLCWKKSLTSEASVQELYL